MTGFREGQPRAPMPDASAGKTNVSILLLGPSRDAVSGVSTHLNQIFRSSLADEFCLYHFQVGSEGRHESRAAKLARFLLSPLQFAWQLATKRPTIVHINTSMDLKGYWRDVAYLLLAVLFRRRVLYQVHGGALPGDFFARSRVLTSMLRMILRLPDLVVVLARKEEEAYRQFAPGMSLALVPNAIEVGADPSEKAYVRPDQPLRIGFVGRLIEGKGIFEIVDALALLSNRGIPASLILAGSGPDEARLRQRVSDSRLDACVHFAGPVHGAERDRIWNDCDLFAFPTDCREGLPYALLESMAARTPPVVTAVGAIPDVVEDGVHGIIIPPRDAAALARAIERLHHNRGFIACMGAAGRQRIEQSYTVERLAHKLRGVYLGMALRNGRIASQRAA